MVIMSIARARSWDAVAVERAREAVEGSMAAETLSGEGFVWVISPVEDCLGMGLWAYRWKMSGNEDGRERMDWRVM